jgi:hypothetical protein
MFSDWNGIFLKVWKSYDTKFFQAVKYSEINYFIFNTHSVNFGLRIHATHLC